MRLTVTHRPSYLNNRTTAQHTARHSEYSETKNNGIKKSRNVRATSSRWVANHSIRLPFASLILLHSGKRSPSHGYRVITTITNYQNYHNYHLCLLPLFTTFVAIDFARTVGVVRAGSDASTAPRSLRYPCSYRSYRSCCSCSHDPIAETKRFERATGRSSHDYHHLLHHHGSIVVVRVAIESL